MLQLRKKKHFNKIFSLLIKKKLFLFDMDGTIYIDSELFDGTLEMLSYIREIGGRYVFITNNSSKSVSDYVSKLKKMGIDALENDFFTSTQATALYIKKFYKNKCFYCLGTHSMIDELKENGINIVTDYSSPHIEGILVGYDTELKYEEWGSVCNLLNEKNLPFIATNPDKVCPCKEGFVPDCAAICEGIFYATGKKPKYIGKPDPTMIDFVIDNSKYSKEETVVIGDRLYTDILAGINAKTTTVCVLSGETSLEDIKKSKIKPSIILEDIKEMYTTMKS